MNRRPFLVSAALLASAIALGVGLSARPGRGQISDALREVGRFGVAATGDTLYVIDTVNGRCYRHNPAGGWEFLESPVPQIRTDP
ncbi:hypothetical protein [Tautonia plasticadhaerens]|uniref:Uncharacterized protein n=1 Tax=Tautonia plasticadhaerens TaxID=2527974 RepID=A0A518HAY3_9BACT|nr:hypothetical protein [Tautonia plasticadhaerens]QDV38022.1 hypothetical protein ElP_59700 [Tautonia plasticadhaerens]